MGLFGDQKLGLTSLLNNLHIMTASLIYTRISKHNTCHFGRPDKLIINLLISR